jgi:HAE1 family hydrophobic/amphiphilic exporter-1
VLAAVALAAPVAAQTQPPAGNSVRISVDDAVRMALDHNVDLSADRIDPQISDTRVAAANALFRPTFNSGLNRNNAIQPPSSFLIPTPTQNDAVTSNAGLSQRLPWFGTSYNVAWNAVHTNSNSFLSSYDPLVQSGLTLGFSQPLVRDLSIDAARQNLMATRIGRDVADTRLRESIVHTTANTRSAYWGLVSAIANVDARTQALNLSRELVRVNKAKVDVGQSPPLDLVSAEAEVAANEEQVIIAETLVHQAEDRLRLLIYDPTDRAVWALKLDPTDSPPIAQPALDVDAAITRALGGRTDIARSKKDIENADVNVKYTANQKLPDVRLNASYAASGLGGTQVLRDGGFPGTIVGPGSSIDFGSVLNQLFSHNYPTWVVGVSLSYPLGQSNEEANYARARLEKTQATERLKSNQGRAIQQVRDAAYKIDMNAKRIATTRAATNLAEQRLDAEQKRFDVGLSTSFLVIQAQRDLAQAKANEVSAVLAYDLALVDFEELQEAGPSGQAAVADASAPAQTAAPVAALPSAAAAAAGVRPATVVGVPGF